MNQTDQTYTRHVFIVWGHPSQTYMTHPYRGVCLVWVSGLKRRVSVNEVEIEGQHGK